MHAFGARYDPVHGEVDWWLDGVLFISAEAPYVPAVARKQRFYLLISAKSHGESKPYAMYVTGIRAYVPSSSRLPAH